VTLRLFRQHCFALALSVGALAAAPASAASASASDSSVWQGAQHFAHSVAQAHDDPLRALAEEQRFLAQARSSASGERALWSLLTQSRIHVLLEQPTQAAQVLAAAGAELDALPAATAEHRLAHRLQVLQASTLTEDPQVSMPQVEALVGEVRAIGHARLACEAENLRTWFLLETGALDAAFRSAQGAEHCARELGQVEMQANAIAQLGTLARMANASVRGEAGSLMHFRRALDTLGERPARYARSVIEWELGKTIDAADRERKLQHLQRARALSTEIGDDIGMALASVDIAVVELESGRPAEALRMARIAREAYLRHHAQQRIPATYAVSIAAMTQLNDRALAQEIAAARRWDLPLAAPDQRARLARAAAEALASLDQHKQAYGELARSIKLDIEGRNEESNRSMRRLQAAYEAAQREAENSRLRLRDESARLQLEAAAARQQTLWVALGALGVMLVAALWMAARTLRQRREMADLALRDELTGAPNRRAILATAQAQWLHSRRLGLPLGIALIDLDHFKRVNDSYGHDTGDHVLQAFASAAARTLRAQDRLGRYGGEEWLLVVPGASAADMRAIFARLRTGFANTPIDGLPAPHALTFSMGAVIGNGKHADVQALIAEADRRLYGAKAGGRDRPVVDEERPTPLTLVVAAGA
jgi:diguanylate cyclase (GGDEF)-like protein